MHRFSTPRDNGDLLASEIRNTSISRISRESEVVWPVKAPDVRCLYDDFLTKDGKRVIEADGMRHRAVVIDRQPKKMIWQYGVTDTPGHAPGNHFCPDGFDLDVHRDR